jgi:hypothetical protein
MENTDGSRFNPNPYPKMETEEKELSRFSDSDSGSGSDSGSQSENDQHNGTVRKHPQQQQQQHDAITTPPATDPPQPIKTPPSLASSVSEGTDACRRPVLDISADWSGRVFAITVNESVTSVPFNMVSYKKPKDSSDYRREIQVSDARNNLEVFFRVKPGVVPQDVILREKESEDFFSTKKENEWRSYASCFYSIVSASFDGNNSISKSTTTIKIPNVKSVVDYWDEVFEQELSKLIHVRVLKTDNVSEDQFINIPSYTSTFVANEDTADVPFPCFLRKEPAKESDPPFPRFLRKKSPTGSGSFDSGEGIDTRSKGSGARCRPSPFCAFERGSHVNRLEDDGSTPSCSFGSVPPPVRFQPLTDPEEEDDENEEEEEDDENEEEENEEDRDENEDKEDDDKENKHTETIPSFRLPFAPLSSSPSRRPRKLPSRPFKRQGLVVKKLYVTNFYNRQMF